MGRFDFGLPPLGEGFMLGPDGSLQLKTFSQVFDGWRLPLPFNLTVQDVTLSEEDLCGLPELHVRNKS